jgi:NAD(P)-dependent dehydrogenase (short-subunit alcohol dehydrogenase family)
MTTSKRFENKVVIVTGGGQVHELLKRISKNKKGIGRELCRGFAAEGAHVVIADTMKEAGKENEEYILKR